MDQIIDNIFKDKKEELKILNRVSSVPQFRKPYYTPSEKNVNDKKDKKSQNNKNFYYLCDVNNIITLDQKLDYYMLLRQNATDFFPDLRIESIVFKINLAANPNTRISRESGKFNAKISESNDKSLLQKSDKKEFSISSSSKDNSITQKYLSDLKSKYKNIEEFNFNNNRSLEAFINEINSKSMSFKDSYNNYENLVIV